MELEQYTAPSSLRARQYAAACASVRTAAYARQYRSILQHARMHIRVCLQFYSIRGPGPRPPSAPPILFPAPIPVIPQRSSSDPDTETRGWSSRQGRRKGEEESALHNQEREEREAATEREACRKWKKYMLYCTPMRAFLPCEQKKVVIQACAPILRAVPVAIPMRAKRTIASEPAAAEIKIRKGQDLMIHPRNHRDRRCVTAQQSDVGRP